MGSAGKGAPVRGPGLHLALAQFNAGRFLEAEAMCRAILLAEPNEPQALQLLGSLHLQSGRTDEAVDYFRRAVAAAPRAAQPRNNLGVGLLAMGQIKEAVAALKAAVKNDPNLASAYINLGDALMRLDRPREAIDALRRAVALQPSNARAQTNLGAALVKVHKLDAAVQALKKAIDLDPRLPEAHGNLGSAYLALGRQAEAVACHEKAVALQPGFRSGEWSVQYLALGRFEEGWRRYLDRPTIRTATLPLHRQPLPLDLAVQRILLGKDQGLGDEIMFLRLAPELKRRGAHVTYLAGAKILSLIRRASFLDAVIGEEAELPRADMVLSVGDLPYLLAMNSPGGIPPSIELPPLPENVKAQAAALAAVGPPPYIGVTWRGGLREKDKLLKIAPLERIGSVLRQVPGTLIALQRLPDKGELQKIARAAGRPVHDFTALNDRLEDMLALLALLDEYVCVSNTNVHLRATQGKGSRVLIPSPAEFRWMASGAVSPWFPNCPLYRQDAGGSWDAALAALAADLVAALGTAGPASDGESQS